MERVDALIEPGEEILWEGGPHGRAPRGDSILIIIVALAAIVLPMLAVAAAIVVHHRERTLDWVIRPDKIEVYGDREWASTIGFQPPLLTLPGPLYPVPNPLFPRFPLPAITLLCFFIGAAEIYYQVHWRSRRYVLTTRRLIASSGLWLHAFTARARTGREKLDERARGFEISGLAGKPVVLQGVREATDREAIELALARFDATPAAPIARAVNARRWATVAAALVAIAIGLVIAIAPWRVAVRATRLARTGTEEIVRLELSAPAWGSRAADGLLIDFASCDRAVAHVNAVLGQTGLSATEKRGLLRRHAVYEIHIHAPVPRNVVRLEYDVLDAGRRIFGATGLRAIEVGPNDDVTRDPYAR